MSGGASLRQARRAHVAYIRTQLADGHPKRVDAANIAPIDERMKMLSISANGVFRQAQDTCDVRDVIIHISERPIVRPAVRFI